MTEPDSPLSRSSAGSPVSEPFTIRGQTAVAAGRLARLEAPPGSATDGCVWVIVPSADVDRADTGDTICQFVAPPGRYEITLVRARMSNLGSCQVAVATTTVNVTRNGAC